MFAPTISIKHSTRISSQHNHARKVIKRQIRKKAIHLNLLIDNFLYRIQNKFTKKPLELINEFSKITDYDIIIFYFYDIIIFYFYILAISTEIKNRIAFTIAKKKKILRYNTYLEKCIEFVW